MSESYLGIDVHKRFCVFCEIDADGGVVRRGRFALVEAAITAARKSAALMRLYYRVLHRSNSQKARVAVARKLAVIVYAMMLKGDAFHG
jgi:hypothetical protein